MAAEAWQPGYLYRPGALVVPAGGSASPSTTLTNPGFETALTGWTPSGGGWSSEALNPVSGARRATFVGSSPSTTLISNDQKPATAGMKVSVGAYSNVYASPASCSTYVDIYWFNASNVQIGFSPGAIGGPPNTGWHHRTTTDIAPAGTSYFRVGLRVHAVAGQYASFDDVTISYPDYTTTPGLMYQATQASSGLSGATEPTWPSVVGGTVVDNQVTWTAVYFNRVTWRAIPVLKSGATEPTPWPTVVGETIFDNTIAWRMTARHVSDPNCPNTPYVVVSQGKVYAPSIEGDIIAFSAVNAPLDWSSPNDAGFLPVGQNDFGSNPFRCLGLYRKNLACFNPEGMQLWQIDPDPSLNTILDALPIGSDYHRSFAPLGNDAFFVSQQGVRTVGISATSTSLRAGDVGLPMDPLIQARLQQGLKPIGLYTASAGQYWLIFNLLDNTAEVYVYTASQVGAVGAWSQYLFPHKITDYIFAGDVLVVRSGNNVLEISEAYDKDGIGLLGPALAGIAWTSIIWTPWLEMGGQLGQDKCMEGFDISGYAAVGPTVQFGWDQNDVNAFTPAFQVPYDTVPDYMIPMELTAPSISVKITYTGGDWRFSAMNVYLEGRRLAK